MYKIKTQRVKERKQVTFPFALNHVLPFLPLTIVVTILSKS